MSRYSIFGYYGQGNAGDEAILAALIDGIKDCNPLAHVAVYSDSPLETEILHGVDAYRFFSLQAMAILKNLLGANRSSYFHSVLNFFRTDIVIIGGGGLFFDTPETNRWMLGYVKLIKLSKWFGKKVAVVGVSIGPLHHATSGSAVVAAFNQADMVSVRDAASKTLLIHCGLAAGKVSVVPDLVFTLAPATGARIDEIMEAEDFWVSEHRNIAVTPCSYNARKPGWLEQYTAFCNMAAQELDANLWFIPMQRGTLHDDMDAIRNLCEAVAEPTKAKIKVLHGHYSAREIQGLISRADFVFAERLHGSIMAINSRTQFLSIAYAPKVTGVLTQAKLADRVISMESFLSGEYLIPAVTKIREFFTSPIKYPVDNTAAGNNASRNFTLLMSLDTGASVSDSKFTSNPNIQPK